MNKKLNTILLIDDQPLNNAFHEWIIKKNDAAENVVSKESAFDGLKYLKENNNPKPDLILLDINMPGMNGWEFLEQYQRDFKDASVIVMLTTSDDPNDIEMAKKFPILADFKTKPLTKEMLNNIIETHCSKP